MLLATLLKGIVVGLSVSVPLGPIGMLIIQRTLTRGRKSGIMTGLGATASDLVYAAIVMFFLSFIIGFLENNKLILQLLGSIIVIVFGIFIFKSNPVVLPTIKDSDASYSKSSDFFTSFFLTLSNPLMIFVLIALFAQLNFIDTDSSLISLFAGFLGVFIGAFSWWLMMTSIVHKYRHLLNRKGLKLVNRITGIAIVIIGIVSTFYSIL